MISFGEQKCIEWIGTKVSGYGYFKQKTIHRQLAEFLHGAKLTSKDFVCHSCNNRGCINPNHLYIGNAKTNAEDIVKCGVKKRANEKTRQTLLGVKHSEERCKNQSLAQKRLYENGYINPRKGKSGNPNSGSFVVGRPSPNKGRKRIMVDGKIKCVFIED